MEDAWGRETTGLVVVHCRAPKKRRVSSRPEGVGETSQDVNCVCVCVCVCDQTDSEFKRGRPRGQIK